MEVDETIGKQLAATFLEALKSLEIDIRHCRGQGYDNGTNLKGKNEGVQAHILRINSKAFDLPGSCHMPSIPGSLYRQPDHYYRIYCVKRSFSLAVSIKMRDNRKLTTLI